MADYFLYEWSEKHQVKYCPCGKQPTIDRYADGSARLWCSDYFIMKCTKVSVSEGDTVAEAIKTWNENVDDYKVWMGRKVVQL